MHTELMYMAYFGKLYLIPLPIAADTAEKVIPSSVRHIIQELDYFLVENVRTARRYISQLGHPRSITDLEFICLDKYTSAQEVASYMKPVIQGRDAGILSEAGCPGIADPGTLAVQYAQQHHIKVVPLVGPSSILLALMASGLNGQNFVFHGYLPIDKQKRKKIIHELERTAWQLSQTQIFIETPYRNQALFETLLAICYPHTLLCIGKHITAQGGWIQTQSIQYWRTHKPTLDKVPVVFLLSGK